MGCSAVWGVGVEWRVKGVGCRVGCRVSVRESTVISRAGSRMWGVGSMERAMAIVAPLLQSPTHRLDPRAGQVAGF